MDFSHSLRMDNTKPESTVIGFIKIKFQIANYGQYFYREI